MITRAQPTRRLVASSTIKSMAVPMRTSHSSKCPPRKINSSISHKMYIWAIITMAIKEKSITAHQL